MRLIAIAGALLFQASTPAQEPRQFDVAVIRPSLPNVVDSSLQTFAGGRIKISNEPVKLLIRIGYGLQNSEIAGGPAWLESDRYDIEAKTGSPEKPKISQVGPLVQNLLADRFHLKFHREKREQTVYALIVAKGGPKLKPSGEGETPGVINNDGKGLSQSFATATSIDMLAKYVGNRLHQIVIDRTGLTGTYDFKLEWAPDELPDSQSPSLTTALREQLGLRLETQKAPVDVLVIDNIDRPSEN